jgi:MFS family permease
MLLSALGTSIANVGLPTLVQAFDASFQAVQWVVLAYLLAVTTLVVSAGRLGDALGRAGCCWPGWVCSPWPRPCAAWRPPSGC